jgi:penicillin-binding protein 2
MRNRWFKRRQRDYQINPDEIFLDTANVSGLDQQQFEGVFEKPLNKNALVVTIIFLVAVLMLFTGRLVSLQILQGEHYFAVSENNRLRHIPVFAKRGVVYDRNNVELAWNGEPNEDSRYTIRNYIKDPGYAHLLGYVNYPKKDARGYYWREGIVGQTGVEKEYQDILAGRDGAILVEADALGNVITENTMQIPVSGENITLSIDSRLQSAMFRAIESQAKASEFQGGAALVMDVDSGELLVMTNYPEFDSAIMSDGSDREAIQGFFQNQNKPFLNRSLLGVYSPGSTIKPFVALGALSEGVINASTRIFSSGKIEVPNPYNPEQSAIFRDWREEGHGSTDVRHAIADSVNTFFYLITGGNQRWDGIGIAGIEKYTRLFDLSEKTGIEFGDEAEGTIPNPTWKKKLFNDNWRLGDTYITSIGQFGFQVTPIQMVRGIAGLANGGNLPIPKIIKSEGMHESEHVQEEIPREYYDLVRAGMRDTVTKGTAQNLNVPYVDVAVKTGTAQVGVDNEFYHSWVVGFMPYEEPQYSFAIVLERAPEDQEGSASRAMRTFLDDIYNNYPEFFKNM